MKILYVTDLHGDQGKYSRALEIAKAQGAAAVVNGGDMFPTDADLFHQGRFISGFLNRHFKAFDEAGIYCLCYPGNDDLIVFDPLFEEVCQRHPFVIPLAQRKFDLQGFEFIGMNWVADYPFRLKDRCRMDTPETEFGPQLGTAVLSTPGGWMEISDWFTHARGLPTLRDELERLPRPNNPGRVIYVIHMPPRGLELDVCGHGARVGSTAVHEFIATLQPRLTLHGHIHESPEAGGTWRTRLGDTVCIQPGQLGPLTWVEIDLDRMQLARRRDSREGVLGGPNGHGGLSRK